ncbi:winged helix-turn-helix domain-containing protein [Saccharothrix sp. NEAU-S10]|nr:winged helix-turn-helix domain-containing protein [Saccharothrix luteola]
MFGQVEVRSEGRSLDVGTPRQQAVLAALVVDARRPVAIGTLIDRVWDHAPPADPRAVLYSHLSRIRRLLEQAAAPAGATAVRVERRHAGYVLDVDPESVDLHRFRRLVDQGEDPRRDDEDRAAALAEALGLWRGSPLAGLPGEWAAQVRDSWDRRRLDAVVQWARLELRLGRPGSVLTALPDLAAEHPLVEPLEALLMSALHATGRGAEALDRYTAVRQRLADELGADPGPELRAAHQAVLRGEPQNSAVSATHRADDEPSAPEDSAPETPHVPEAPGWLRRRTVLVALIAVGLLASIGSVLAFQRDEDTPPSVERAHELFATARELDQEGRGEDARAALVDAVRLYGELVELDPERNAPPLAPAIIEALRTAGVDFSVTRDVLLTWLANPAFTPYPAISQVLLLQGWRFTDPVFLDVIVWNYEQAPGMTSPRAAADVEPEVLKTAVVAGSNSRHGTSGTDFERLLES